MFFPQTDERRRRKSKETNSQGRGLRGVSYRSSGFVTILEFQGEHFFPSYARSRMSRQDGDQPEMET